MLYFSKWKTGVIWGFALLGILCALPNLIPEKSLSTYPPIVREMRLNLGLDLRGGSHLLMQMDKKALQDKQLKVLRGAVRQVLRGKRDEGAATPAIRAKALTVKSGAVEFRPFNEADLDKAFERVKTLIEPMPATSFGATPGNNLDVLKTDDCLGGGIIEQRLHSLDERV